MGIRIYTEKVKVPGSRFEHYAIMSKLSEQWTIKHLRFIDPVIDDDGNIFPFVRKDHIIFIDGLAVSVISLAYFLDNVMQDAYTDDPASVYVKRPGNDPIETLIRALERIEVVNICPYSQSIGYIVTILPKEEKKGSPWDVFFNLIVDVNYSKDNIEFEDEITDF
jgi:phosphatidylserine decarboxylase